MVTAVQQVWYVKFFPIDKLHKIEQIIAHHASNLASETVVSPLPKFLLTRNAPQLVSYEIPVRVVVLGPHP